MTMTENIDRIDLTENPYAVALVATIRSAVNGVGKYAAYVTNTPGVTRATVKDHALALAILAYPNEKPVQKKDGVRTKFGKAVAAAGNGLRAALEDDETTAKPAVLRVSLSGEGGGTTIVPEDHPLYAALVELLGAEQA